MKRMRLFILPVLLSSCSFIRVHKLQKIFRSEQFVIESPYNPDFLNPNPYPWKTYCIENINDTVKLTFGGCNSNGQQVIIPMEKLTELRDIFKQELRNKKNNSCSHGGGTYKFNSAKQAMSYIPRDCAFNGFYEWIYEIEKTTANTRANKSGVNSGH